MSADLGLNKGDIYIGSDGDLAKVRNTSKLVQDVLKVLHTPIDSNPFSPNLGTNLTTLNIGQNINIQFAEAKVRASVTKAIETIQLIQRRQELIQFVSSEEKIVKILDLEVGINEVEPRQYDVKLIVSSGSLSNNAVVLPSFTLSTIVG